MLFLYRTAIWMYGLIIYGFSPFRFKADLFSKGRANLFDEIEFDFKNNQDKPVWFHAASVGEFEQARPIIELLKNEKPELKILITFFSPSGYELRKGYPLADYVYYLPLDTRSNAKRFLEITNPSVAVFIKYEFWYFFLEQLQEKKIPTYVASAVFRSNQWFFHSTGRFLWKKIRNIDWFFVQDQRSFDLLEQKGINQKELAGDTRCDRVIQVRAKSEEVPGLETFKGDNRLMILGSIWPEDIRILESFIRSNSYGLKWIIASHEMNESFLKKLNDLPGSVRYSHYLNEQKEGTSILILNTVGQLAACYRYSDFAYVGGGFRGALHNLLEPAVFGQPIFFGDHANNQKFIEASELINCGGGFSFSAIEAFEAKFDHLWTDEEAYGQAARASRKFVEAKSGATKIVVNKIIESL